MSGRSDYTDLRPRKPTHKHTHKTMTTKRRKRKKKRKRKKGFVAWMDFYKRDSNENHFPNQKKKRRRRKTTKKRL